MILRPSDWSTNQHNQPTKQPSNWTNPPNKKAAHEMIKPMTDRPADRDQPTDRQTNLSTNQPDNQPTNQPTHPFTNQPTDKETQPINESTKHKTH